MSIEFEWMIFIVTLCVSIWMIYMAGKENKK
jgi:hypothetical protein